MISRIRTSTIATASAFALFLGSSASAEQITTNANSLPTVTWTFNGTSETGLAGTLSTNFADRPGSGTFDTYCIDLYHTFYLGNTWNETAKTIQSFAGNTGNVPGGDYAGGNGNAIGYLYGADAGSVTTAIQGAALQIAIWSVEYDGPGTSTTPPGGPFQFANSVTDQTQAAVYAQANAYLQAFGLGGAYNPAVTYNATLFQATHDGNLYQDLVGPGAGPDFNPGIVPEPSSIAMVVIGLGLGTAARIRRVRRAARRPA